MIYRPRARQLPVVQQYHDTLDVAIDNAVNDEGILRNLRDLGLSD